MLKRFTCTPDADGDLAGKPASLFGWDEENREMILLFDDGSKLGVRVEQLEVVVIPK